MAAVEVMLTATDLLQVFVGDFFTWEHDQVQDWDLGFDYTLLCALHPSQRGNWAAAWARYLGQPGARLACLAFPLNSDRETGPPWPLTVQLYRDLLEAQGGLARQQSVCAFATLG
jgi:hypothetical protein